MKEQGELSGNRVNFEGEKYQGQFIGNRKSSTYPRRGEWGGTETNYWWEGTGEILNREIGKVYRFLFTSRRTEFSSVRENLPEAILYYDCKGADERYLKPPRIANEQVMSQIIDLALEKIVQKVEEFEASPQLKRTFVPSVPIEPVIIEELVELGLVFDDQAQLHMVFK